MTVKRNPPCLQGLVLAGGKSVRMGQDKALLYFEGGRFIDRAVSLLNKLTPRAIVSCARAGDFPEYECAPDRVPGQGPGQGILAGLESARDNGFDGILALACDLPRMGAEPLRALIERHAARPGGKLATLYVNPDSGKEEMLAAVYDIAFIGILSQGLARGEKSLRRLLPRAAANYVPLPAKWRFMFINCNTPDDLLRIQTP